MLFSHTFDSFAVACLLYGTFVGLPSAQAAPQLDKRAVSNVNLGARALVGDTSCPAVDSSGGLTGRVFAVVSLAEQGTVSTLNTRLADITANVQTCICVTAGVAVGNIVPSSSLNAQALADVRAAAQTSVGAALSGLLSNPLNVLSVTLTPTAAAPCGSCLPNQQPGCASGVCSCTDCPTGQFYSASRGQCVVSPSPLARARVKARSEALAAEADMRCSGGAKNSKCNQPRDVLHMRQATREAVVERYNRTLTNNARKPVRYQRLELVSQ